LNNIIKEDISSIINCFDYWERFKNKTILITGANGFLPAYLVESFLSLDKTYNTKIIAIVRNKQKANNRFKNYMTDTNLEIIEHDVCNEFNYNHKIDFIIHAASQASPKYYKVDPVGTLNANVLGTINMLKLAQTKSVESFLYFSSGEVYGEVKDEFMPIKEDTFGYLNPALVRSCYGESKRMGETICVSYFAQYGIKAKIVRPFHTYGPGMALDDGRVYADFVANIIKDQNIILNSDGKAKRAFCYLTDATIGFLTVLVNGENGEAYNVGNPQEEYSILELANILVNLYPEKKIEVILNKTINADYLKSTITRNSPNIDKLKKLNWNPTVTIEKGFKRTVSSFL
jgi:nucleoside-diphosphate-sugar epimerase